MWRGRRGGTAAVPSEAMCRSTCTVNCTNNRSRRAVNVYGCGVPRACVKVNHCLFYISTVIRFCRTLVNIVGECFATKTVQWCGKMYEIWGNQMGHINWNHRMHIWLLYTKDYFTRCSCPSVFTPKGQTWWGEHTWRVPAGNTVNEIQRFNDIHNHSEAKQ